MKQVSLREANQQFSRIVREVEESGERVLVLRNGRPAVEIAPTSVARTRRTLTREQENAIRAFLASASRRPGSSKGARRWSRDELHER